MRISVLSDRAFCSTILDILVGINLEVSIGLIRREMDVWVPPLGKATFIVTIMNDESSLMCLLLNELRVMSNSQKNLLINLTCKIFCYCSSRPRTP